MSKIGMVFLCAFLFMAYSRLVDYVAPQLHLPFFVGSIALFCAALAGGIQRSLTSLVGLSLLGFTGWLVIATPLSYWKGGSVELLMVWGKSLLIFFMIVGLAQTLRQARQAMFTLAVAAMTITFMCFYYGATSAERLSLPYGILKNPNDLAQILLFGLPFWLLLAMNEAGVPFRRTVAAMCILLILIVVTYTGSRSAIVAVGILALFVFRNASTAGKIKLVAVATVLAGLSLLMLPDAVRARYISFLVEDSEVDSTTAQVQTIESTEQRIFLFKESIEFTVRNPLFGVGPGQFQAVSAVQAGEEGRAAAWRETHCTYTQISSEAGLPALAFYLSAMFFSLKLNYSIYRKARRHAALSDLAVMAYALLLALISFSVTALFSSIAYHAYFPTLAGFSIVFAKVAQAEMNARRMPAPSVATARPGIRNTRAASKSMARV